jgi:DNA-binding SARP family transcriptional activator
VAVTVRERVRQARSLTKGGDKLEVVRLRLLNGFEVTRHDRVIALPMSAQRLVAFLALSHRLALRGYVAGTLWPEASEAHAGASLRSSLWRLHQSRLDLVRTTRRQLGLAPGVRVDVRVMADQARRLIDPDAECRPSDFDLELLSGDLLPDWYEEWVAVEREGIRQLRLHGLEAMSRRLTEMGHYGEAIQAALAAVSEEPLRESAHIALIQAHLAEGNAAEAIRHYSSYRRTLFDELGVDPSPAMEGLLDQFRVRDIAVTL